jgi:mono/diheme cytochrome c family protein
MPSFAGQIPDDQVWKIVAYISSLAESPGRGEGGADR